MIASSRGAALAVVCVGHRVGGAAGAACLMRVAGARLQAALTRSSCPPSIPHTKFTSGQNVVPYFEGWIRNADGTFDLVFGYFNRNWEEELAIPAGPDNIVEPGGPDRGQPTYFLPRRQGWVFRVRVPTDFGKQVLTWTIKANGKTEKAYGELLPVEEITERIIMTRGNLNPGDERSEQAAGARDRAGRQRRPRARRSRSRRTVTDDGLPKPRVPVQRPTDGDRRDDGFRRRRTRRPPPGRAGLT